mmetsp:Transcript_4781/g.7217  ORF Transcript_4781/g.7217 Transcript_4781/m.7217 type:complete len:121 (-) Transcript_4781:1151-1513(-)
MEAIRRVKEGVNDCARFAKLWRVERDACKEEVDARAACQRVYGKFGEECTTARLKEKRCLAANLCEVEYIRFYHGSPSCADVAERFNNEPDAKPVKLSRQCRDISYALGQCLHGHTKWRG